MSSQILDILTKHYPRGGHNSVPIPQIEQTIKKIILLPVEHQHLVFKLPSQLSTLWLLNKKATAKILFDSVGETFEHLRKADGIMRKIISVLHITRKNLSDHPGRMASRCGAPTSRISIPW